MTTSLKKNFIYVLLQQLILIGLPFLTIPYISRVLGPGGVGLYSYSFSIITLFINVFLLGSNLYAVRAIAKSREGNGGLAATFSEILTIRTALLALASGAYFIFVQFMDHKWIFYLQYIHLFGAFFDITWLYQGLEQFKKVVIRNILVKLLGFGSVFIFVKNEEDLAIYTIIMASSVLIGNTALFYRINDFVKFTWSINAATFRMHLLQMLVLFIPAFSAMIYSVMDKTLLGILSTTEQVGYYEQSYKIVFMIASLIGISGTVMLPRTSSIIERRDFEKLRQVLHQGVAYTILLVLPITLGFVLISEEFVLWFLGSKFEPSVLVAMVLAPVIIFKSLGVIFGSWYLVPMEMNKEYTLPIVFGAVVNIIINVLLIPRYGAAGAATSTVITEGLIVVIQIWFLRNVLDFKSIFKTFFVKYLIFAVVMYGVTNWAVSFLSFNIFFSILVKVVIGVIIYLGLLLIFKDKLLADFRFQIKRRK